MRNPHGSDQSAPTPFLRPVPAFEPPIEATRPPLRLVRAGTDSPRKAPPTACPARPDPVDPAALVGAQHVLRLAVEVQDGRRSPHQLRDLVAPGLMGALVTAARTPIGTRMHTGRLQRVHVQQVNATVAEAFATVFRGPRAHAVAARLELGRHGWRCTALRLGC